MRYKSILLASLVLPAVTLLSACGGGGGAISSTPPPPVLVPPPPAPPPPPPPPTTNFDTTEYRQSDALVQARAISAYQAGASGSGIVVGVIDSGVVATNPQFAGRIHTASTDVAGSRGLGDDDGHGTNVSQIILGAKDDSGTHGVAFNAILLAARSDTPGTCTDPDPDSGCTHDDRAIARGVDLSVANGARVINISLGGSPANSVLRTAIDRATAAGVVIVFSAGNEFDTDPIAAANPDPLAAIATEAIARGTIIIAGALDDGHQISSFSNRAGSGSTFYLSALGARVCCVYLTDGTLRRQGTSVFVQSGTSFSAPVISGAVALLAQAFPNLTGRQIVDLLLRTADDLGATGTDAIYGRGELNLARAFQPQGSTALAGSQIAVSLDSNGMLSNPMGDAGNTGFSAIIQDSYGRAYNVDLTGTIRSSVQTPSLAPSLAIGTRTLAASGGNTAIALSVAGNAAGNGVSLDALLLSPNDRNRARALAGSVVSRLDKNTQFAIGYARSSAGLVDQMAVDRAASFLIADAATQGWGFHQSPKAAFAFRHQVAGLGISLSAETGAARIWEQDSLTALRDGYRGHAYSATGIRLDQKLGRLSFIAGATQLTENETILGAQLDLLSGGQGARSWFGDAEARLSLGRHWRLGAAYRRGWTRIGAGGLRNGADWLQTQAWSFDVSRDQIFSARDGLSLRVSQPLRVAKGGFNLTLPTGYDYATGTTQYGVSRFNLAPDGRETDAEVSYHLAVAGGFLGTNLYWRQQPGNVAIAPDDIGMAVRFTRGF